MDTINKLNSLGSLKTTPFKKINELVKDEEYPVTEIKQIPTKNGNKLVVCLMDSEWGDFIVFLPDRCNKNTSEKEIKALNKIPDLKFIYKGTKDCGKGNPAYLFEFLF